MPRVLQGCLALLMTMTVAACSDEEAKTADLVRDACAAYLESNVVEGEPPLTPEQQLDSIATAVAKAEEAAELDDQWIEFSIAMERVQARRVAEVEAIPSGIAPPPDPLFFAARGTVQTTCSKTAG